MGFPNPSDSTEIFYGASGDVRDEVNAYVLASTAGHYSDETELPGSLIVASLRRATRLIDTYLEVAYSEKLPITAAADVPRIIDEIASDIGVYYVLRSMTAKLGRVSDDKKQQYFDIYTDPENGMLVRIADKKMQIPELSAVTPLEGKSVRERNRHPVFDVNSELNQGLDPDLQRDIERERDK